MKISVFLAVALLCLSSTRAQEDFSVANNVLIDLSTLLLQVTKLFGGLDWLPDLTYDLTYTDCPIMNGTCDNLHDQINLSGARFSGIDKKQLQLDFQPTSFSYSLQIPAASLDSEAYQRFITNLDTNVQTVYGGLHMNIDNATFGIAGDFIVPKSGGIQVGNIDITLVLDRLSYSVDSVIQNVDGNWSDLEPINVDIGPQISQLWNEKDNSGVTYEERYEKHVQTQINCFLSGGKSDASCENGGKTVTVKVQPSLLKLFSHPRQ